MKTIPRLCGVGRSRRSGSEGSWESRKGKERERSAELGGEKEEKVLGATKSGESVHAAGGVASARKREGEKLLRLLGR